MSKERSDAENEQFVPIEPFPTCMTYDLRVEFTEEVVDPVLKARLLDALRGKGAFRRFLGVVREAPETEPKWFAMEAAWLSQEVDEWLEENALTKT